MTARGAMIGNHKRTYHGSGACGSSYKLWLPYHQRYSRKPRCARARHFGPLSSMRGIPSRSLNLPGRSTCSPSPVAAYGSMHAALGPSSWRVKPVARVKSIPANNLDPTSSSFPAPMDRAPIPHSKYPQALRFSIGRSNGLTHRTLDQLRALGVHDTSKAFADIEATRRLSAMLSGPHCCSNGIAAASPSASPRA
jgi:hypothetical protein